MHNAKIINTLNSDNSNIAYTKTQHHHIMKNITSKILKFKPVIEKPLVKHHIFFAVITFSNINFFAYINSFVIQNL